MAPSAAAPAAAVDNAVNIDKGGGKGGGGKGKGSKGKSEGKGKGKGTGKGSKGKGKGGNGGSGKNYGDDAASDGDDGDGDGDSGDGESEEQRLLKKLGSLPRVEESPEEIAKWIEVRARALHALDRAVQKHRTRGTTSARVILMIG